MSDLVVKKPDKNMFVQYVHQRIGKNKNFLMALTGPTGSGKSWACLKLGEMIDPDFDERNVCFSPRQFMELVNGVTKKLKPGCVIVWDEIQIGMSNIEWQSQSARLINYVLTTFRHRNFVLIVSTPSFSFLNKTSRMLFHCHTETQGIDVKRGLCILKPLFLQLSQRDDKIYMKYLRIATGKGAVPFKRLFVGKPSPDLIKKYEVAKQSFTSGLNESILEELYAAELKKSPKKQLTKKQEEVVKMYRSGMKQAEIAELLDISVAAVSEHMKYARKKGVVVNTTKGFSSSFKKKEATEPNLIFDGGDFDE